MADDNEFTPDNNGRYNVAPGKPIAVYVSGVDSRTRKVVPAGGPPDMAKIDWRGGQQPASPNWLAHFKVQPRGSTSAETTFTITVSDTTKNYFIIHDNIAEYIRAGNSSINITTSDPSVGWG